MIDVVAAAEPSANRIQCPTSNSRAVCFRKAIETSAPGPRWLLELPTPGLAARIRAGFSAVR